MTGEQVEEILVDRFNTYEREGEVNGWVDGMAMGKADVTPDSFARGMELSRTCDSRIVFGTRSSFVTREACGLD